MKPVTRIFREGTHLFREKDRSRELYIIQGGRVKVYRTIGTREVELGSMVKGSVLGEMALIDGRPRSASAKVVESCSATIIDADTFESRIRGVPSWFMTIIRMVSTKIRNAHKHLERIQMDQRGINVILAFQYLLHRAKSSATQEKSSSINTGEVITELSGILSIGSDYIIKVLDFMSGHEFISVNDNVILCSDPDRFDEYCAFLRHYVRKSFEKLPSVPQIVGQAIYEMQRSLKADENLQAIVTMSGQEFHIIMTAIGYDDSEESLFNELKKINLLVAVKDKPLEDGLDADHILYIKGQLLYLYSLMARFISQVPDL